MVEHSPKILASEEKGTSTPDTGAVCEAVTCD